MTLLSPGALLLALVAVPIVLMYVLRLRRPERLVSSTLLWPSLVGDMQANAPWQRLRPSILLVLQLVALLALVVALAGPAYSRNAVISRDIIVLLDQSYSMRSRDVLPNRFDAARVSALALVRSLPAGNVMSVIGMGRQPHLAIAESSDHAALDRAIQALSPEVATPNTLAALSLASSLARRGESTQAVLFTDHSSGVNALPLRVPFPVDIARLGGIRHDLGITSFAAQGGSHTAAVIRIRNFGPSGSSSDLDLYADGRLADVRTFDVAPGAEHTETWNDLPSGIRVLQARLTRVDDMRPDKVAWAVVSATQRRRVLLVSDGNYFLHTALTLDASVALHTISPALYKPSLADAYDAVIFDGTLPKSLPGTSVLLVGPPAGRLAGIQIGRPHNLSLSPIVRSSTRDNASILRYVDLSDVHIARTRSLGLPRWLAPLARAGAAPVMAAGNYRSSRIALIAFRIQESDWPLRISFPVAVRNLVSYLAPGVVVQAPDILSGSPVTLVPPAEARELQITRPDGANEQLRPPFPPFADTSLPGIYRVRAVPGGATGGLFAVNDFSARGADVRGPAISHLGHRSSEGQRRVSSPSGIEWAFSLLVLALLTAEWWVAFKR